jgi:acetylornithine deacetylase/succinyl-diaminopimelate desuccinylase-like protein
MGIPAITMGCFRGGGAHTREEWVDIASLTPGYRIALEMVLSKFRR